MRSLFVPALLTLLFAGALSLALKRAMQRQSRPSTTPQRSLWLLSEFGHATKAVRDTATPLTCKRTWRSAHKAPTAPSEDALRGALYLSMTRWLRWQHVRSKQ